jgi:hypothetical protein
MARNAWVLRRIATGMRAIRAPTNGRQFYLSRELADALGVTQSSVSRWIGRGYIRAERCAGFMLISVDEAVRFSREGPPRIDPASRPRQRDPVSEGVSP